MNKRDPLGSTALLYAYEKGARDIVKLLIEGGADITQANNAGQTPLHFAAKSAHKEIMRLLIESGGDINATDKTGKTPLIYAAQNGKTGDGARCSPPARTNPSVKTKGTQRSTTRPPTGCATWWRCCRRARRATTGATRHCI